MRLALLIALAMSLPARAQWQMIFVSTQICIESSKISTSLGQAERAAAAREKRVPRGEAIIADCESNDECEGYCIQGKCVDAIDEHESARVEPTPAPVPLETPNVSRCTADAQCGEGQSCMSGYCMSAPPPPSSLLQRATELYVRENAAQLRQDLALGEGPVIATLARWRRVSAKDLGKLMRAHRELLIATMGDRGDTKWSARFLDQLIAVQTAHLPLLAKRGEGQG